MRRGPANLTCGGRLSRRRLLQIGGLGSLGLNLATSNHWQRSAGAAQGAELAGAEAADVSRAIEACIVIFYYGGPSHIDTWDRKPLAPAEVRGEFRSVSTRVPGLSVCEHLPHCANIWDQVAQIRSMHHPMRNHNSAAVEALCGRTPLRGDLELLSNDPNTDFPCFGSAASRLLSPTEVPTYVALPHVMYNVVMLPGQTAGFLGAAYEPLRVQSDPNHPAFAVPELSLPAHLTARDLEERERLAQYLDAQSARVEQQAAVTGLDASYQRAFSILHSESVRHSLDLDQEDPRTRDRYGRTTHGQSVLLARRLIEAGVRFVSVYDKVTNGLDNWDTHVANFTRLKDQLLPPMDQAFAALVADLQERGLLHTTLVVGIGEFGRTPQINSQGGRDHWPDCFTVLLAGGGVQGGSVYGSSDRLGAYPETDPTTPGDLAATIFWRFGLDPAATLHDASGRPYRLAEGAPMRALFDA